MLGVACVLLYMGIGKGFEPLLLVPIAFGMLLANLPVTGLFAEPVYDPVTHSGTVGFMWVLYQASSMPSIRRSSLWELAL